MLRTRGDIGGEQPREDTFLVEFQPRHGPKKRVFYDGKRTCVVCVIDHAVFCRIVGLFWNALRFLFFVRKLMANNLYPTIFIWQLFQSSVYRYIDLFFSFVVILLHFVANVARIRSFGNIAKNLIITFLRFEKENVLIFRNWKKNFFLQLVGKNIVI